MPVDLARRTSNCHRDLVSPGVEVRGDNPTGRVGHPVTGQVPGVAVDGPTRAGGEGDRLATPGVGLVDADNHGRFPARPVVVAERAESDTRPATRPVEAGVDRVDVVTSPDEDGSVDDCGRGVDPPVGLDGPDPLAGCREGVQPLRPADKDPVAGDRRRGANRSAGLERPVLVAGRREGRQAVGPADEYSIAGDCR